MTVSVPSSAVPCGTQAATVLGRLAEHAMQRPHVTALASIDADGSLQNATSWLELQRLVECCADAIRAVMNVGEVVLLEDVAGATLVPWLLACLAAGVRALPVHPQATRSECRRLADEAGAAARIQGPAGSGAAIETLKPPSGRGITSGSSCAEGSHRKAHPAAIVLQSSGTTGGARLVIRDLPALDADGRQVALAADLSPQDAIAAAIPLCHSYGLDMLLGSVYAGSALHVQDPFDAPALAQHLSRHATIFPGVPHMFDALARLAPHATPSRLRLAFSAGSVLPARVGDAFHQSWGLRVGQLYGASELGAVTLGRPDAPNFDPAAVGTAMAGVEIRILDPSDSSQILPPGREGHIAIKAPSMLAAYLPAARMPLADGHLLTGDLGRLDQRGRLYITGRLKLLIDVGGLKVNPLDVETAICSHPAVSECVVVPLVASDTVTRLRAICVTRSSTPPTEESLRAFLREQLAPHKVPRTFEFVAALPRSPSGKVLRGQVPTP